MIIRFPPGFSYTNIELISIDDEFMYMKRIRSILSSISFSYSGVHLKAVSFRIKS